MVLNMGNIVLLDELTINQIAAGEVIERPASVIKEMVENSIDAGATNITVEIKNGGISYIRVTDNGKGIAKDDVELAFERHATSKIRSAQDLNDIKSMGFRGEALASIAAIANVELITKTESENIGTKIVVEGGNVLNIEEIGATKGTSITVRNLFYNTPVRYKFLKKDFTETGYIEDVITRIALVHPEIAIKLINTGKVAIQTSGNGDIKAVIYNIYGKDIAKDVLPVSYEYEYIKVEGVIGKPNIARSNRSNQIFFVNKRYIKDRTLSSGAEQAFKGLLPIGKYGFIILNLEMNPNKVDVNVHPAKLEVRFEEESVAFKAVYHAIKNALLSADLISDREKHKEAKEASKNAFKIVEEEKEEINTNQGGLFNRQQVNENKSEEPTNVFERLKKLQQELRNQIAANPKIQLTEDYKKIEQKYMEIANAANQIGKELDDSIHEKDNVTENEKVSINTSQEQENIVDEKHKIQKEEQDSNKLEEEENKKQEIEPNSEEIDNNKIEFKVDEISEKVQNIENPESSSEKEYKESNEISAEIQVVENSDENSDAEKSSEVQIVENIHKSANEENNENSNEEIIENAEEINVENSDAKEVENASQEQEQTIESVNEKILSFEEMYKKLFGKEPYNGRKDVGTKKDEYKIEQDDLSDNISIFEDIEEYKKIPYKFIGIAFKTYIILEMGQELYIMDQHAAHERIMYEKVKSNFYSSEQKNSQMLLLPDIITLTGKEMSIAKDNFDLFEKAGFILEEFGENTIKLSGVPEICVDLETKELFLETLDEINTVARTAKQEKEEKFLATVACKAAVKANMALTEEEVTSLMDELLKLKNPFTCPHGRPTVIKMSKYDIERKFARKQ